MAFLINCPNCGKRSVYEFKFGGEYKQPPDQGAGMKEWCNYLHFNQNSSGVQDEWWYHAVGCRDWIKIRRNTSTHEMIEE